MRPPSPGPTAATTAPSGSQAPSPEETSSSETEETADVVSPGTFSSEPTPVRSISESFEFKHEQPLANRGLSISSEPGRLPVGKSASNRKQPFLDRKSVSQPHIGNGGQLRSVSTGEILMGQLRALRSGRSWLSAARSDGAAQPRRTALARSQTMALGTSSRESGSMRVVYPVEEHVNRCKEVLNRLRRGEKVSGCELEEEFEGLFKYKNRYVKARVLHHAVYSAHQDGDESASAVRLVLDADADVNGKASYVKDGKLNQLEAIHIAAGLGHVPSMKVLVEKAETTVALLNTYCVLEEEDFYTPIHDAAYLGCKDAVIWLLENRADASKCNRDGYTPLHLLAVKGLEPEGDLEAVVRSLLKHRARLDLLTAKDVGMKRAGKIPLELAAADDSGFPRRLVHLLAPSFQARRGGDAEYSFFDDMCVLSSLNTAAANQLARQLLESADPDVHARVRADAQKENAVDRMANLFHMAPEAAADMLEILMVKPVVQDSGRHPIRSRASLWGLFYSKPMRCEYQADAEEQRAGGLGALRLRWPVWKYDSTKTDDMYMKDQPNLQWHLSLVKRPHESEERREYVDDVDVKVVLLPNILDIDIFMALASTRESMQRIFAKLPVQGIIHCLWDHLMVPAVVTRLLFNGLDLTVQSMWGLNSVGAGTNSHLYAPVWWSIIVAGLMRDVSNMLWWFYAHCCKWYGHYRAFRKWQEDVAGGDNTLQRPPSLHSLWRPQAFFSFTLVFTEMPLYAAKAWFVWDVRHLGEGDPAATLSDVQQAMLTANALLQFFRLIYMLRLTNSGKRVTTILSAFFSGAISEMFVVTSLFFGAVALAFAMLKRKHASAWIGLYLYRGLLFGDGEALDYMGLDPKEQTEGTYIRTMLMLLATLLFNIVILNLTIAVYSSEYDRLEKESELHFQRERSRACCELLLSIQKLRLRGPGELWILWTAKALVGLAILLGAALLGLQLGPLALRGFTAACLFTFAQVGIQAINMSSHWFPRRDDGQEGPADEHFLWICHRSNYSEDCFVKDENTAIEERFGRLDEKLNVQISRLDERVGSMGGHLESKIDCLAEQLRKVLQLQEQIQEQMQAQVSDAIRLGNG